MVTGYKIRIYPTEEQEILINKHFGACRFIWNYMLGIQEQRKQNGLPYLFPCEMMKLLTEIKKTEFPWLKEVSNTSLQMTCTKLWKAYERFFKKISRYPKYKKKNKCKLSYPVNNHRFYFEDNIVQIQKLGKVKYKTDLIFPKGKDILYHQIYITKIGNKYMLSFILDKDTEQKELTETKMGIDLGVKETAVVAFGNEKIIFPNINKSKEIRSLENEIKFHQKEAQRKYKQQYKTTKTYNKTKNIEKEEEKIRKLYRKLSNIRHDYINKITKTLIDKAPSIVTMETLDVIQMTKNKHLSKKVIDQNFYEFIRQMKYKCEWNGIPFRQTPINFPSSKMCSCCGNVKTNLKLSDRKYICDKCGLTIDRDYNAALNLMRYEA